MEFMEEEMEQKEKTRKVIVAAVQMQCSRKMEENLKKAEHFVREAAKKGAKIILLPELFER